MKRVGWERAMGGEVICLNERWYRVRKVYDTQGSPWVVEHRLDGVWRHLELAATLTNGKRCVLEREGM